MKFTWDMANAFINKKGLHVVKMLCRANNPCSPSSRIGGDIDYEGKIFIDLTTRRLTFDGKIDAFPAFEAYATINDGAGVPLFKEYPPVGHTVMSLPGNANRKIRVTLEDKKFSGIFVKNAAVSTKKI